MKALVFLRHYNDIDHITPVISKWLESGHQCDVVLIGKPKFRNDYRVEFLATLQGTRVAHIRDLLPSLEFFGWRLQTLLLANRLRRSIVSPLVNALARTYSVDRRQPLWSSTACRLLERSFTAADRGVVVFDWITRDSPVSVEWVEVVVSLARSKGLGTVSLPHGDSPHATQLIRHREWSLKPDSLYSAARVFDKLVVPNELCAERFRPFLDDQSIVVLGSPRYCDEWLMKLAELSPAPPAILPQKELCRKEPKGTEESTETEGLKVVIFLRKSNFTTFWEEIEEIVGMIAAFPNVELVIKPHTRGGWRQPLTRNASLRGLPNVSVAPDHIHSIHLMNWAHVIIDLATSVVFEAVKGKKPVLAADYLHAGRSTLAHFMPETELKCRDDVYRRIAGFLSDGCDSFYIEEHRQRFINEMLHVGGTDVLPRYVALLEIQAQASEIENRRKDEFM
ncbi:hypothetical protein SAMN05216412_102245 [Nitrosospira multiformis]|uniref:CDP-Glycerol:Poly(Glycerophosphate) glycerophosphotransferase n=1 Tax=Nitrosospira multiformis TaxID=1231 RepID=A0A1I0AGH0_9PROT|nr:hypothetical protein [Nitrosospira multiformis]SES93285.1 hypothetical protein SAMN05216412_102245 [Nitrosospira multiformis]